MVGAGRLGDRGAIWGAADIPAMFHSTLFSVQISYDEQTGRIVHARTQPVEVCQLRRAFANR